MKSEVTLVITSFNRRDLLKKTIESIVDYNNYLFADIIIVEDSGNKNMNEWLRRNYSFCKLIIHEQNKGAYESIDEAYSHIQTPFVFHGEDDWLFKNSCFIEPALKVLKSNPMIMQVNLSNENNQPIIYNSNYSIFGTNNVWHGFTCNPSIRSMEAYNNVKPWTQWIDKSRDLSVQECVIGQKYYELGYSAAYLNESFCKHIGLGRCTWHENL